jgi:phosphate starvation-inducible protein PhoH and related proteins
MSKTKRSLAQSYNHVNKLNIATTNGKKDEIELKSIVRARSVNQKNVLRTIKENDIVCVDGCAGSGKTFLSVGMAAYYLARKHVDKIIVTRPVIDNDEELGFLPGNLDEKISPYLRPIFDEFSYFFTDEQMKGLRAGEFPKIEIAPLTIIMKGRTFKNAFIILDEAQDATYKQLKRFITRIGEGSKMVITADISQTDLYNHEYDPPIVNIMKKLEGIEGIGHARLDPSDIVRHPLLAQILERI